MAGQDRNLFVYQDFLTQNLADKLKGKLGDMFQKVHKGTLKWTMYFSNNPSVWILILY